MACSMSATARALVRAAVLARDPGAPPAALRRAVFLRFYGHEFEAEDREQILAGLGEDEPPAPPRPVRVDWDELAMALTANDAEWSCYLRTGEVQMVPVDRWRAGEGWPSGEKIDAGLQAGHLLAIALLRSSVEYGWMAELASTVADPTLRHRLEAALDGRARSAGSRTCWPAAPPSGRAGPVLLRAGAGGAAGVAGGTRDRADDGAAERPLG